MKTMSYRTRKRIVNALLLLPIGFWLFFSLLPIVWTIVSSFKPLVDIMTFPPQWVFKPTLENYTGVFAKAQFGRSILNSGVIAVSSTVLTLVMGALCGYSLTRFRFRGSEQIANLMLLTRMFPPITTILPLFLIFLKLGLIDTHLAVVIAHSGSILPFAVWMLRGFFQTVPTELDDAAMIDGCGRLAAFWKVVLPIVRPGLAATGIMAFVGSWNDFFTALILTRINAVTLPAIAASFQSESGGWWGELNAAAVLMMLPTILFTFYMQTHLIKGLAAGGLKG